MGDFKTLLHEASKLYESFVSSLWFGAHVKLPKSHEPLNFRNTYDVMNPCLLKSRDFGAPNHWFETKDS